MAQVTVSLTIGAQTGSATFTGPDARATQFLADLAAIEYAGQGLTNSQAGQQYLDTIAAQIRQKARELEYKRHLTAMPVATNLEGL